jgi:hypothetical protein
MLLVSVAKTKTGGTHRGYGAQVAERLFLFLQMEFAWELGPPDGRYLLRERADEAAGGELDRVVVLDTVGAARRRGRLGARHPQATPDPAPVPTARATVIDPVSVSAERQARAWLAQLDAEHEAGAAASTLNRVLFAHRIATADPHVRELSPAQALVVRAGWGEGEQVAYGRWLHARELRLRERRARRAAVLRSARVNGRSCARSSRCAPASTSTRADSYTPRSSSSRPTAPRWPSSPPRSARTSLCASPSSSSCAPP